MVFPIIGVLGMAMAAAGGYVVYWYECMSKEEKEEADLLAIDYAKQLYNRGLTELTCDQLKRVESLVQQQLSA